MQKAKLFMNGKSQAVRLPKEFRFKGTEVLIQKVGHAVVITSDTNPWQAFTESLDKFTGFIESRKQPRQQKRKFFK